MELKEEIYNLVQNDPDLKNLKTYDKDWLFNSLSGICKAEKLPVNIENMKGFIPTLESDLEHSSLTAGGVSDSEGIEYDYE